MIGDMPLEISGVFSDYRMNLLQVRESSQYHFDNEDVQTIFEITRFIYQGEFAKVKKFYGEKTVKSDVGAVIGKLEGKREMILVFLKAGADTWMIKKASGWSEEEIEAIRRKME